MGPRPRSLAAVLAAAVLLVPAAAAGQGVDEAGGEIAGRVIDGVRDAPVPAARVSIPSLDRQTLAGPGGRFRFRGLPPGTHEIRVEFLGYRTTVGELRVTAGETRQVELRIAPGPVQLEDLEVSARSLTWIPGFVERRENRTGHFFVKREIEEADPDNLTDLLRDAEGVRLGLNLRAHGHSKRYPQFYDRGPGRGLYCRPPVFVDGEMMGPGRPYLHFNEIPPERVLAIEVYVREKDIPETIEYDAMGRLAGEGLPTLSDVASRGGGRAAGPGRGRGGRSGQTRGSFRDVLSAADLEGIFDRRVPQRNEDLDLSGTVLAGLYDRLPRLEHCGAIFVWTKVYPHGDG